MVAPSDFQSFFLGPWRAPEDPLGMGKMKKQALAKRRHEAKHGDCTFTRESGDVCPVPCKYAAIRAVARDIVNMK